MTPAVSSLCEEGDMKDSGLSPRGGVGRLITKDIVDLHEERKYFATAINCSLALTHQLTRMADFMCSDTCHVFSRRSCRSDVCGNTVRHLTDYYCCTSAPNITAVCGN